jgi:predicted NBD/HSP70 family sugar kinase
MKVEGIGFSLPGLLDRAQGKIIYSANLDWRDVDIGAVLRQRFGYDLVFEDNVRSVGLAEIWFGSLGALSQRHLINLVVNEGLGTAVIIGGHLYRGSTFGAGQFGHVSVDPNGAVCRCGNRGCWELYAADTATVNRYLAYAGMPNAANPPTVAELAERASQGDSAARRAIRETGEYLGAGIAILVNALNPEMIVVDGQIGLAWDLVEPEIWRVVRERALAPNFSSLRLKPSSMHENPCLIGAVSLVLCRRFAVARRGNGIESVGVASPH